MFIDTKGKPKCRAPEERHIVNDATCRSAGAAENFRDPVVYKYFVPPGLVFAVRAFTQKGNQLIAEPSSS
jgi:hypothetical protein